MECWAPGRRTPPGTSWGSSSGKSLSPTSLARELTRSVEKYPQMHLVGLNCQRGVAVKEILHCATWCS